MSFVISYVSHGGWWWSVLTGGGSSSACCVGGFCVREMSGGGMASTYHGGLKYTTTNDECRLLFGCHVADGNVAPGFHVRQIGGRGVQTNMRQGGHLLWS